MVNTLYVDPRMKEIVLIFLSVCAVTRKPQYVLHSNVNLSAGCFQSQNMNHESVKRSKYYQPIQSVYE